MKAREAAASYTVQCTVSVACEMCVTCDTWTARLAVRDWRAHREQCWSNALGLVGLEEYYFSKAFVPLDLLPRAGDVRVRVIGLGLGFRLGFGFGFRFGFGLGFIWRCAPGAAC